jgi:DNA mismatch endonuclease Vsr
MNKKFNHTREAKYKIRLARLGKKATKETREKLKILNKGKNNPMFGKHHSIKSKNKISIATKGKNNPFFGRTHSEKTIKHFKFIHKKENLSASTIKKMKNSRLKQIIPFKDTKIEIAVQNELKKRNIIFTRHAPILGQPDIFIAPNICIFIDGDYWHANPNKYNKNFPIFKTKTANDIWKKDKKISNHLINNNYKVLRVWEEYIKQNINDVGNKIENFIFKEMK